MIRTLPIKNYKSIVNSAIELGRVNVFIWANSCGKTNFLEAIALAASYYKGMGILKFEPLPTYTPFRLIDESGGGNLVNFIEWYST
jgi:AAA15 family ATPase/GTPase